MAELRAELVAAHVAPVFDPERIGAINSKIRAMLALMGFVMKEQKTDGRRFTNKWSTDPSAVTALPREHRAMQEMRTIFPHSVVTVDENLGQNLLVSGKNSRKLGKTVEKGRFKGYEIFQLTLEERATCPTDCGVMRLCYGNSMQWARRHRINDIDVFQVMLEAELDEFFETNPGKGMLVRLHVLGDFFSVEYCYVWKEMLDKYPKLAVFGYTHRRPSEKGRQDEIGDSLQVMKETYPDRFRIRWSRDIPVTDGTVVIANTPKAPRIQEGIVCPAQRDATSTCANCALCWESKKDTIVFIAHGQKNAQQKAERAMDDGRAAGAPPCTAGSATAKPAPKIELAAPAVNGSAMRLVRPIEILDEKAPIITKMPEMLLVSPTDLWIEESYQRDLNKQSMAHIRHITINWDWNAYKAPNCFVIPEGLACADGQHTAIAAASRGIERIPVLVGGEATLQQRAAAFVAVNRDRLKMTQYQIFHGEVTAGDEKAKNILAVVRKAGGDVPRYNAGKQYSRPGWITAIRELYRIYTRSPALLDRTVRICVQTNICPIQQTLFSGVREILDHPIYRDVAKLPDERIVLAIKEIRNLEGRALHYAAEKGISRFRGAAIAIAEQARKS